MKSKLSSGFIFPVLFFSFYVRINAQSDSAPSWVWAKSLSATHGIYGHAIAIDPDGSGDIYLAGGFEGTTDFDPGPEIFNLFSGSQTGVGNFIAKYDGSGNFIWAKAMAGVAGGSGSPYSIAIDPTGIGAIYTAGRLLGTIDFDPGTNSYNLSSAGNNDIFISKLDGEGNFLWAKRMGGPADDYGISLAFDPGGSGNVYTTGQFRGTVDFDPGDSTFNLISAGNFDIFISKLDGEGNFIWARAIGGTGDDAGRAIAFDPLENGKVYTTGFFEETVDFDPGADTFDLTAVANQENFISILDGSGNFLLAKQVGRINLEDLDRLGSIALDPSGSGEVYITGYFQGTGDFDPGDNTFSLTSGGNSDVFISRLSDSCQFTWAGAMGGTSLDVGRDIAVQPGGSGNVFTMGMFKGTADFDPGPDSVGLTPGGAKAAFISKVDSSGNFQWAKAIKGGDTYGDDIVTDNCFLYISGVFFGNSITFDSITIPNVITPGWNPDLFFAKLSINETCIVSVAEIKQLPINIYPNPATNELTIEIDGDEFFNVDITLFNVLGEVVYSSPGENIGYKKTIDISTLAKGIYFVELRMNGSSVIKKVVKA